MDVLSVLGLGALGGLTYLVLNVYRNGFEWIAKDKVKLLHLLLAVIAAYLAYLVGLPNSLNSFLIGFVAPTFLDEITNGTTRLRKKE